MATKDGRGYWHCGATKPDGQMCWSMVSGPGQRCRFHPKPNPLEDNVVPDYVQIDVTPDGMEVTNIAAPAPSPVGPMLCRMLDLDFDRVTELVIEVMNGGRVAAVNARMRFVENDADLLRARLEAPCPTE